MTQYNKTTWIPHQTVGTADIMNNIEKGIERVSTELEANTNNFTYKRLSEFKTSQNTYTQAFNVALNNCDELIIDVGEFDIDSDISLNSSLRCRTIKGIDKSKSKLIMNNCSFIIENEGFTLKDFMLNGLNKRHNGLNVKEGVSCKNLDIYNFKIGININNENSHVINALFHRCVVAYCIDGVKVVSKNVAQNNVTIFDNVYISKCGVDSDNLTSNATMESGYGMFIDGAFSLDIKNCVFEYNTGIGLYLNSNSYQLYGCSVNNCYFERNKYANFYIDKSNKYPMDRLNVEGNFYTDAGFDQVPNALNERGLYLVEKNINLNTPIRNNNIENYSYADRNIDLRKYNFLNAIPFSDFSDLKGIYPNIKNHNGIECLNITKNTPGVMFYNELIFLDPKFNYKLKYKCKNLGSTRPILKIALIDNKTDISLTSNDVYVENNEVEHTKDVIGIPRNSKEIRLYIHIDTGLSDDLDVLVYDLCLVPILT